MAEIFDLPYELVVFRTKHLWTYMFDDRELSEILLAQQYTKYFKHGTSGHLSYTVINKLCEALLLTEKP